MRRMPMRVRESEMDDEVRRLVRPMTAAEREEHARGYSLRPLRIAPISRLPVDRAMRSGRALAYGLAALRRSDP